METNALTGERNPPEHPEQAQIQLVDVLHALSDPVRLQIVRFLAASDHEVACGTIPLPVSKSTGSHHYKVLREAGVTRARDAGTQRLLRLRRDDLDARFPGLLDAVLHSAP
jgi:DNA-binding transcriptional ArsR family regulator